MKGLLYALVGLLTAGPLACAAPETGDVRPRQTVSKAAADRDAGQADDPEPDAGAPGPADPVDSGGGGSATTYIGTLDATPTVRFGGSPYCYYDVTLKSVEIEIAALPSGDIIGAGVKDTMVEASVPPCTYGASPPSPQTFAFTTAKTTTDGTELAFKGATANYPGTNLVVSLKKVGGSYEAAARWHRTDQSAPLDWTVSTKITLGPR